MLIFFFGCGGGGSENCGEVILDGVEPGIINGSVQGLIRDVSNAGQTGVVGPGVGLDNVAAHVS